MSRLDALPGAEERLCVVCGHTDIVSAVVHVFRGVVGLAFHCHRDACREDVTAHGYLNVTDHARTLGLLPKEEVSDRG